MRQRALVTSPPTEAWRNMGKGEEEVKIELLW